MYTSGSIGIGTTAPNLQYELHLHNPGSASDGPYALFTNAATGTASVADWLTTLCKYGCDVQPCTT
jgi:hypothetical protein